MLGVGVVGEQVTTLEFAEFLRTAEPKLRRAFVARYGVDAGVEACAEAVAYAWQHWERLRGMANPVGYLFRVGQTAERSRRRAGRSLRFPVEVPADAIEPEPQLGPALASLNPDQRAAVLLVHAHGYSYAEAAEILDLRVTTLRNHLHRGLTRLRRQLGEHE